MAERLGASALDLLKRLVWVVPEEQADQITKARRELHQVRAELRRLREELFAGSPPSRSVRTYWTGRLASYHEHMVDGRLGFDVKAQVAEIGRVVGEAQKVVKDLDEHRVELGGLSSWRALLDAEGHQAGGRAQRERTVAQQAPRAGGRGHVPVRRRVDRDGHAGRAGAGVAADAQRVRAAVDHGRRQGRWGVAGAVLRVPQAVLAGQRLDLGHGSTAPRCCAGCCSTRGGCGGWTCSAGRRTTRARRRNARRRSWTRSSRRCSGRSCPCRSRPAHSWPRKSSPASTRAEGELSPSSMKLAELASWGLHWRIICEELPRLRPGHHRRPGRRRGRAFAR